MKKSETLIEKACREIPSFGLSCSKLHRQYELAGKSESTVVNYSRCLAQMAQHFKCCPSELDKEQVLDYLQHLKNLHTCTEPSRSETPSESYFKHTVYGLRAHDYCLHIRRT